MNRQVKILTKIERDNKTDRERKKENSRESLNGDLSPWLQILYRPNPIPKTSKVFIVNSLFCLITLEILITCNKGILSNISGKGQPHFAAVPIGKLQL
jgi:hypothetical protein